MHSSLIHYYLISKIFSKGCLTDFQYTCFVCHYVKLTVHSALTQAHLLSKYFHFMPIYTFTHAPLEVFVLNVSDELRDYVILCQ